MSRNPLLDYLDDNLNVIVNRKTDSFTGHESGAITISEVVIFAPDGSRVSTHKITPVTLCKEDSLTITYEVKFE